jgi:hypothetical protein
MTFNFFFENFIALLQEKNPGIEVGGVEMDEKN